MNGCFDLQPEKSILYALGAAPRKRGFSIDQIDKSRQIIFQCQVEFEQCVQQNSMLNEIL